MTKSLANEPVGDDERDAGKYAESSYSGEIGTCCWDTGYEGFKNGRKGMVPKSAVEEAVRSEQNRILTILNEHLNLHQYLTNGPTGIFQAILTPTNQGEKE